MVKVNVAKLITKRGFYRNEDNYNRILSVLVAQLNIFGTAGSLKDIKVTAPAYAELPSGSDEIIIPNAWVAKYVDIIRKVTITGSLYIGG